MLKNPNKINIINRKAKFEYFFVDTLEAGIVLSGTEVKSIRMGKAGLTDAYCLFHDGELYIKSLYVAEYDLGTHYNHKTRRDRKLLLKKAELKKWARRVTEKGFTVVPYRLFISERGFVKLEIKLAQGKKSFDKRNTIKERDVKRDMDRAMKQYK